MKFFKVVAKSGLEVFINADHLVSFRLTTKEDFPVNPGGNESDTYDEDSIGFGRVLLTGSEWFYIDKESAKAVQRLIELNKV